jgi:hypothetical protein
MFYSFIGPTPIRPLFGFYRSGSRPKAGGHRRVNGQGSGCFVAWTSGPRLRRPAAELRATPDGIAHGPWIAFDIDQMDLT